MDLASVIANSCSAARTRLSIGCLPPKLHDVEEFDPVRRRTVKTNKSAAARYRRNVEGRRGISILLGRDRGEDDGRLRPRFRRMRKAPAFKRDGCLPAAGQAKGDCKSKYIGSKERCLFRRLQVTIPLCWEDFGALKKGQKGIMDGGTGVTA